MAKKVEKPTYARSVVFETRTLNPPGRFLKRGKLKKKQNPAWYYDIGDDKAIEKATFALRDLPKKKWIDFIPSSKILTVLSKDNPHNVSIRLGDIPGDMLSELESHTRPFQNGPSPKNGDGLHRVSLQPVNGTDFGGAHQSNATIQYPERSNAHLNSQVSRVTNDSDPSHDTNASKKNGLHNSQFEGNTNGYVSGARAVASSMSDATQKRLCSSELSFGGRRSSMEEALNRRQSSMSSINSWKVGDEADNDQESVEEEWGKKFNDRTHRIKDSLENSLLMNSSVMSSILTDRMESLTSSFDQTTLVADSKRDSDLLVPLPETTQTQRSNSTFDELLESMFSNFERRAPKRRRSIREYMDDMSDPHKKTRLSDSSHLYPIGYDILQSPLLGSFQDMISQQNVSSLTHEDGSKNESVSRSSDCSDELRNWISKEIRMSEGRRISELISEEDNFNEEDYTDDQVLSIVSAHLNSGYEEDHVYLRETYRPASIMKV